MVKLAPEYELVLMLDPEVSDERRDQIAVEARRRIEDGGDLKQERAWGLRKMAYEINQRTEADYRFFRFERGDQVLDQLNHNLKITDGVLRYRIFKVDPDAPVIDPPPPVSLASAAAERTGGRRRDERAPRGPEPESASAEPPPASDEPAGEAPEAETPAPEAAEPESEAAEREADAAEPEAPAPVEAEPTEAPDDEQR